MAEGRSRISRFAISSGVVVSHFAGAVIASVAIGFFPEGAFNKVLYNTWLDVFVPFMTVTAAALGFVVARKWNDRRAIWTWIPGLIWFGLAAFDLANGRKDTWPHSTLPMLFDNLLGPTDRCAGSECVYELFCTAPLFCSIAYSIASWITLRARSTVAPIIS